MTIIDQGLVSASLITQGYATNGGIATAVAMVYARTRTLTVKAMARTRTVLARKRG